MKLGENLDSAGGYVQVSQEDLCSGVYIIGRAGRGKSALLEYCIYQQINNGRSVIVLDGHGDLVEKVIAGMSENRIKDKTYLLDLSDRDWPFSLNIFACDNVDDEIQRDSTRNQVLHAFDKLFPGTEEQQYFGDVLEAVIATLIYNPTLTVAHIPRLLADASFRQPYVKQVKDFVTLLYWDEYARLPESEQRKRTEALLRRLRRKIFTESVVTNMICQPGAKINFRQFIDEGKILLVKLPTEIEQYRKSAPIIGTLVMAMIYAAVFSYGETDKRPGVSIFADEFQYFATDEQVKLFTGARKYLAKTFLAHQYQKQLDEVGLPQSSKDGLLSANTIIAFSTTPEDSKTVARGFSGLRRRPTNIAVNPLERLDSHESPFIKDFYLRYVLPLEIGAKLRITTAKDTYGSEKETLPTFDFGFGQTVSFRPEQLQALRRQFNNLLYYTQVNESIDELALHTFIYETYRPFVGSLPFDMVPDEEGRQKRQTLQEEIDKIKYTLKFIHNLIEDFGVKKEAVQKDVGAIIYEAEGNYRKWRISRADLDWSEQETKYHLGRVHSIYSLQRYDDKTIWLINNIEGDTVKLRGVDVTKQYNAFFQACEVIESAYESRKVQDEKLQELERQLNATPTMKRVERTDILEQFQTTVRTVLETLIAEPIALDKAELSTSDIGDLLLQLEKRHAYVKVGSQVFRMKTLDLKREKEPPSPDVVKRRRNTIVEQTRKAFCRPRVEVERAIQSILAPQSQEPPQATGTPQNESGGAAEAWQPYEEL
jgi:hypothetical protein